ncbi:MAG: SDR family NAD(P)-dependent oxidoreductase [Bradymonadaceae bacterium]
MTLTNENESLETVLVTGADGALGSVVAGTFADAGCTVVGADIGVESDELQPVADEEEQYEVYLDATDPTSVEHVVGAVEDEFGSVDALVNCAGGFRWTPIDRAGDDEIDFLMGANLRSGLLMVREVVEGMKERGFGRIVLMSSKSTLAPGEGEGPYASTKAGLNALTQSVAEEVQPRDVTINAILPSVIDTPANREEMPDADVSKWVEREQLAEIIFRLTQSFGEPINGALIPVTGGM